MGAGVAGLCITLHLTSHRVTIISNQALGDGGSSSWAQGGIAAALGEGDTPEQHAQDTLKCGCGLSREESVLTLTRGANASVHELLSYGIHFDRDEKGELSLGQEAAHNQRRIVKIQGAQIGPALMKRLAARARAIPSLQIFEYHDMLKLITNKKGRVCGAMTIDKNQDIHTFSARYVVLCTGGLGALYKTTTNPPEAIGHGIAAALCAGALIENPEFVQFHPTTLSVDADPSPLLSEALRGEGAYIVDEKGQRFVKNEDPRGSLAPRDIVARAVFTHIRKGHQAFLDARTLDLEKDFHSIYNNCIAHGLNPRHDLLPIKTASHYHMGGIKVTREGKTNLEGLYACGEASSTGVHGANRLASNSLLEALVFGRILAKHLSHNIELNTLPSFKSLQATTPPTISLTKASVYESRLRELRALMDEKVGVIRHARGLQEFMRTLSKLKEENKDTRLDNHIISSLTIALAAFYRQESRGAHFREDFPAQSASWQRPTLFSLASVEKAPQIAELCNT